MFNTLRIDLLQKKGVYWRHQPSYSLPVTIFLSNLLLYPGTENEQDSYVCSQSLKREQDSSKYENNAVMINECKFHIHVERKGVTLRRKISLSEHISNSGTT